MSSDTQRRVIVTGAAGFIGSHVVCHLTELGLDVVAVDADPGWRDHLRAVVDSGAVRFEATGKRWPYVLPQAALAGADAIVHLAYAEPTSPGSEIAQEVGENLVPTLAMLEALPASVSTVVFASTALIYGRSRRGPLAEDLAPDPDAPYALAKVAVEQGLREWANDLGAAGAPRCARSLRFATVYGPAETVPRAVPNFIRALLAGEPPHVAIAEDARDYVHVADVARAVGLAVQAPGAGCDAINVGTGRRTTTAEVAQHCVMAVGDGAAGTAPRIGEPGRDPVELVLDPTHAREQIGFNATIELSEGLVSEVEWFRVNRVPAC